MGLCERHELDKGEYRPGVNEQTGKEYIKAEPEKW